MNTRFAFLTSLSLVLCLTTALAAFADDFVFKQEFGQVQGRGDAQIRNSANGPLIVSNIGSSGQDGVRINTGSGGSIGPIRWMAPEFRPGRGLNVVVDAEDPTGIPCAFSTGFTYGDTGAVFVFDRLTSPFTDLIVRCYDGGNPIFEAQVEIGTNPLFESIGPPSGFGTTGPFLPIPPYDDSIFGWLFPGGTTVTVNGTPVQTEMVSLSLVSGPPEMTLVGCEILGLEPQGSHGELLITDFPSSQFHHRFGRIGQATPLMVDNLGSSGLDGVRVSNLGSSGLDGVCIALNPDDTGLGVHLEPMDASSGDVLSFGGLSLTPQPTDRTPLPKVTSSYADSFFDIWTDLTVNDPPTAVRFYEGDAQVGEMLFPSSAVRLRVPAGKTSVQHPYQLFMSRDEDADRLTFSYAWHTALVFTDDTGIDQDCDRVELDFENADKIGGPWYDWDAIELAALLILLSEIDINGAPNGSGGFSDEPILLDSATALGAASLSRDVNGRLKISNLGSSGCDGVSLAPPGGGTGSGIGAEWELASPLDPHRGHVTVLKAHGGGGGGAGGVIRVNISPADTNGGEWGVAADYSAFGDGDVSYEIYNEGQLIDTIICAGTLEECLGLTAVPTSVEVILDHPDGRPRMRLGLPPLTRYIDKSSPLKRLELAGVVDVCYDLTATSTPFTEITALDIMMGDMGGEFLVTSAGETSGYASTSSLMPYANTLNLRAPSPNPFNPSTEIAFELSRAADISLQVFDLRGQMVRELVRGVRPAGEFRANWDGLDGDGRRVASGTYIFRLSGNGDVQSRKAVLVK